LIKAKLRVRVPNRISAKSLIHALKPDNFKMAGLTVVGRTKLGYTIFGVEFQGEIETFIFTLDDMLRCLQAAKATLDSIARKELE
jgi:hypothetical protein